MRLLLFTESLDAEFTPAGERFSWRLPLTSSEYEETKNTLRNCLVAKNSGSLILQTLLTWFWEAEACFWFLSLNFDEESFLFLLTFKGENLFLFFREGVWVSFHYKGHYNMFSLPYKKGGHTQGVESGSSFYVSFTMTFHKVKKQWEEKLHKIEVQKRTDQMA